MSFPARSPGTAAALVALRAALTAMCLGVAWWRITEPDSLSGLLLFDLEWCNEATADGLSLVFALLYGCAGILLWTRAARPAALWICAWTLVLMTVKLLRDPYWPETTPGAWAVRWWAPLALWIWLGRCARSEDTPGRLVETGLRLAAASTFVFHGVKAFGLLPFSAQLVEPNAEYLDFLATFHRTLTGDSLEQATAERILRAVGVLDVAVAVMLLVGRFWIIALWMTLWGFFTAALRVFEYEDSGWMRFLIRAPNGGVPLVLLLLWLRRSPAQPAGARPASSAATPS